MAHPARDRYELMHSPVLSQGYKSFWNSVLPDADLVETSARLHFHCYMKFTLNTFKVQMCSVHNGTYAELHTISEPYSTMFLTLHKLSSQLNIADDGATTWQ
jgi:hypothetical protein